MTKRVVIAFVILFLPVFLINPVILNSSLLGVVFSYISFYQFSYTQSSFLQKRNKGILFVSYILRLFIYGIPMGIGLFYKNYFNFFVILVFLFFFQSYYIWIEFFRSLRKVRRQNK
tara:strand:+ start:7590 stop:7937 length:348 start_codon:yes stop_codon:yes gene_type:complete